MYTEIKSGDGSLQGYSDDETGKLFSRFKGGISFAGFVAVVGEAYNTDPDKPRPLKVLVEAQESNLHDLAKRVGTLQSLYPVSRWTCDEEGDGAELAKLFEHFAEKLELKVSLTQQSLPADLNLSLQVIRRHFKQRTIQLPEGGILAGKIEALARMDPGEAKAQESEEVIVLGAVVHKFDTETWPPSSYTPKLPRV